MDAHPTFRISTPLLGLEEAVRIGTLQIVLRADTWLEGIEELTALPPFHLDTFRLVDAAGASLPLGVV